MKQFNVRDETHVLGRELSIKTGKSLLDVVQEALARYDEGLKGNEVEDLILQKAATVIDEHMCQVVHEEVVHAMDEVRRLMEELREQQSREFDRILREAIPEAPEDDLKEVSYGEIYGERNRNRKLEQEQSD